jgi:hypothetical protein
MYREMRSCCCTNDCKGTARKIIENISQYTKLQPGCLTKWSRFVGLASVEIVLAHARCGARLLTRGACASTVRVALRWWHQSLSPYRTLAVPCGCSDQWSPEHCSQAVIMSRPIQLKQSFDVPVRITACPLITRHCVRGNEILFSHTSTRCKNCIGSDLYSRGIWFESLPGTRYPVFAVPPNRIPEYGPRSFPVRQK